MSKKENGVVYATDKNPAKEEFKSYCFFWVGVVAFLALVISFVSLFY